MDFRGPRTRGPPFPSFRQRGGGGNNPNNHHPIHNQHHTPQLQPRVFAHTMNPSQWNPQTSMNAYNTQDESLNYAPQQPYGADVGGYNNYPYHQGVPSTELTPQAQNFAYGQQMFLSQPPIFTMDPVCFPQPPMTTTPPMVSAGENVSPRKFHYNSKETTLHCAKCNHKNALAETEIIKRDDQIDALTKQNEAYNKQIESLMTENETLINDNEALRAENASLRSKLGNNQPLSFREEPSVGLTEAQNSVNEEVSENSVKPLNETESHSSDDLNGKRSLLSPDAMEFSPKKKNGSASVVTSCSSDHVPVVSARGVMDEDGDATTPVLGNEAGTQVEESLFEENVQSHTSEVFSTADVSFVDLSKEDLTTQEQYQDWSEEVDKTTVQAKTPRESKVEPVVTQVPAMADDEGQESIPTSEACSEPKNLKQDRRQGRGSRFSKQPPPGFGRGRLNHQNEQDHNDGNRQHNYPNRNRSDKVYSNQSFPHQTRFPRQNEENRENFHGHGHRRHHDDRNNRGQSHRYEGDQKQSDERENRSREIGDRLRDNGESENRSRERTNIQKSEERNSRQRDSFSKHAWFKEGPSRETSEQKDTRESGSQGQGAWRGKNNNFHFNKDDNKEGSSGQGASHGRNTNVNFNKDDYKEESHARSIQNKGSRSIGKVEIPDIFNEVKGDLFSAPGEFSLAHCVGQDFRMGKGIAVKFRDEFKKVGELLDQNVQVGGCAHLENNGRFIFYLVTKEFSGGKPKLKNLERSLAAMKEKCMRFGVKKLAMPRIGCGLDKLDWNGVKTSINQTFHDTGIEIRVYEWNVEGVSEAEGNRPDAKSTLPVKYSHMNLVDIASETALIFLGTEDGYMDVTAKSLNAKHHFEEEYKKINKSVRNVVCCKKSPTYDYVYSLIVSKTAKDKVLFTNVESCCSELSQMLRKDQFKFVGFEYPQGWSNDITFFEKILSLFRNALPKHMELWACFPKPEMDHFKTVRD